MMPDVVVKILWKNKYLHLRGVGPPSLMKENMPEPGSNRRERLSLTFPPEVSLKVLGLAEGRSIELYRLWFHLSRLKDLCTKEKVMVQLTEVFTPSQNLKMAAVKLRVFFKMAAVPIGLRNRLSISLLCSALLLFLKNVSVDMVSPVFNWFHILVLSFANDS